MTEKDLEKKVEEFDRIVIGDFLIPIVVSMATAIITYHLLH